MPLIDLDKAIETASEFDKYKKDGLKLYKDLQASQMSLSDRLEKLDPTPKNTDGNPVL